MMIRLCLYHKRLAKNAMILPHMWLTRIPAPAGWVAVERGLAAVMAVEERVGEVLPATPLAGCSSRCRWRSKWRQR